MGFMKGFIIVRVIGPQVQGTAMYVGALHMCVLA